MMSCACLRDDREVAPRVGASRHASALRDRPLPSMVRLPWHKATVLSHYLMNLLLKWPSGEDTHLNWNESNTVSVLPNFGWNWDPWLKILQNDESSRVKTFCNWNRRIRVHHFRALDGPLSEYFPDFFFYSYKILFIMESYQSTFLDFIHTKYICLFPWLNLIILINEPNS